MKRYAALKESDIRKECAPTVNDPQNKALAGVGIPMKLLLWRGSILNLPKRKAENTEIRYKAYNRQQAIENQDSVPL